MKKKIIILITIIFFLNFLMIHLNLVYAYLPLKYITQSNSTNNFNSPIIDSSQTINNTLQIPLPTFTPIPTPIPTTSNDFSINPLQLEKKVSEITDKLLYNQNSECGHIGQSCCGRKTSLLLDKITEPTSTIITFLIPVNLVLKPFFDILIGLFLSAFESIISKAVDLPTNILPFEEMGYCITGYPSNEFKTDQCFCVGSLNFTSARLCGVIDNKDEVKQCFDKCMSNGRGVWTALGCFSSDLSTIIKDKVFGIGIGLAGVVSLFCIIYAAFQIQTSSGNAEKIKKAQELLTSCIIGLMLIIFSVFILRLIGVDILRIPLFM